VYTLGTGTSLGSLNDGNGVFLSNQTGQGRYDFSVTVGGTAVNVNIGTVYDAHGAVTQSAVTTLGGAIDRINSALSAQFGTDVTVSIASDGASLQIHDAQNRAIEVAENPTGGATTARDLGLLTSSPQTGTVSGGRLIAGMNSTLLRTLNGGRGLSGTGALHITARDGTVVDVALPTGGSLEDVLSGINSVGAGKITASLNKAGTGLLLTDHTAGGGNLIVGGDSAASLGIATAVAGVAADTVEGTNLQHQYLTQGTLLSSLRSGAGVGTGSFRITDSTGASQTVSLTDTTKSVDDLIKLINSRGLRVKARVNDQGDGILLYEDTGGGALKIKVEDVTGSVASGLGLAGEASGTGVQNTIDGSQERKVTFAASDTLQSVATKINAANLGVAASVISDGGGSTPFRLSLTAKNTGSAGRFVLDTGGFDLGQTQLDAGQDARVFFGSSDPAKGILLSSSSNTLDQVITGVSIDLASASDSPVTLTITRDNAAIESAVNSLVKAFNDVTDAISDATKYDQDSNTKGVLLGDATTLQIRSRLYSVERANAIGISGPFSNLADIGITVGQNGDLTLSSEKFRAALQQNFQGVADVLTVRVQSPNGATQVGPGITVNDPNAQPVFTSLGLAGQLENMADGFINSVTGTLTRRGKTLADQIDLQHKRIAAFDEQLANKKTVLQRQFLAMEQAIGQLQTQSQALSGFRG
jgi:flagellar hook-associated protein 2